MALKCSYFIQIGNISEAEKSLTLLKGRVLDKSPLYLKMCALLLIKKGLQEEAFVCIEKGIAQNEYDGELYELKGDLLIEKR